MTRLRLRPIRSPQWRITVLDVGFSDEGDTPARFVGEALVSHSPALGHSFEIRIWLRILLACMLLAGSTTNAQDSSLWKVVRYPMDQHVSVQLVSTLPASAGKADDPDSPRTIATPAGQATVTRDQSHTTLEVSAKGLQPGKYFLYTIDGQDRARQLDSVQASFKKTYQLAASDDTFMIMVSKDDNLRALPARNRIVLYSSVPHGLTVAPRQ